MNIYDVLSLVSLLVMFFGLYRNHWVFKKRKEAFDIMGYSIYDAIPSYNTMMLKFWVWDFSKFIK